MLSDMQARNAKPKDKPYRMADSGGMYLDVRPSGVKVWRVRFRHSDGREGTYTIGEYPTVSLLNARSKLAEVKELIKQGIDPRVSRLEQRDANAVTFADLYQMWEAANPHWSARYRWQVTTFLPRHVLPVLGIVPAKQVTAPMIVATVTSITAPSIAKLAQQWIGAIMRHGMVLGIVQGDPSVALHRIIKRREVQHNPHVTGSALSGVWKSLHDYSGQTVTRHALMLLALTFTRGQEVRFAEWSEFDLTNALWTIPKKHMKMREQHVVPLSTQVVDLLQTYRKFTSGRGLVFPGTKDPKVPLTITTFSTALRRIGYAGTLTPHGIRATAATALYDGGWPEEVIERQLAHVERNSVKRAYNHAEHLPARRLMMQVWADYLTGVRDDCLQETQGAGTPPA